MDGSRTPSQGSFARLAVLSILLMLAMYTGFAVVRVLRQPQAASAGSSILPERAETLAAHLDAEAAGLRGGLLATRDILQREIEQPVDAARTGLVVAAGTGKAIGVVGEEGLVALAGKGDGIDWIGVAKSAEASGRDIWLGTVGDKHPSLALASMANTARGKRWIVSVGDPARLTAWLGKVGLEAVTTSDGRVIATNGILNVGDQTETFLNLGPGDLNLQGQLVRGKRPGGQALDIAARPALGGAVVALTRNSLPGRGSQHD